jgi:hypothetical protein
LIVSRKDQSNKIKISPLTNHRSTNKGAIKGGFDRVRLFQGVEKGFDKLFAYQRELAETFSYCNTMKNGSIEEKLAMQEIELRQEQPRFKYIQVERVFSHPFSSENKRTNDDNEYDLSKKEQKRG